MANFKTVMENIGSGIRKFFSSPVAADIEQTGISIAELEFPALTPLLQGVGKSIAVAQALAKQALPTGASDSQIVALALGDAQQAFQVYQTATNTVIETPTQKAIIADLMALFAKIPATSVSTPVATAVGNPT